MKASINKIILYSVLLAAAATACVNDDMTSSGDRVAVQISASTAATRAAGNSWGQNDVIGITMLKAGSAEVIAPYSNYSYATPDGSSNFTPSTSAQIMYFPVDGSAVSFKAYYPYSSKLPAGMVASLSVKDQNSLPDLDFMTAEHLAGTSKDEPDVKLHFYHRLAKVIIDLTTEDNSISLKGCKLVVKGLKTTGSYDIANEKLTIDAGSAADISIPIRNDKGEAIFLPREAAAGVTFEVTTADGGVYTATLKDDVPFKAGYKHTLHIQLMKTPVTVSATIEEWLDGPETHSNVIRVVTGLKDSEGIKEGDTLALFLKDQAEYAYAAKFTYNADGKWTTSTPIYWDDIKADPTHFIGTTVIDAKLNDTQMGDILISKEADVDPYTGVNLELEHAGAKATVVLKSTDNTFSAEELSGATVTFPGYKYTGEVNGKGEFVISDGTKDIVAKDGIAIFPPQTIKQGDVIAVVTLKGKKYEVKADDENFDFGKGVAKKLTLDMSKSEVKVSTKVIPWTEEEHKFKDVRIGSAHLNANEGDLNNGDELTIYTGTDATRVPQGGHFTYNSVSGSWTYSDPTHPLYWEDMPADGNIYASIERPALSNDASANQLPDYIAATPIVNGGGVNNTALNFEMKHQVAQVIVVLKSSTYTLEELRNSTVTLPSYMTGGKMENGLFVPGTTKANIKLPNLTTDAVNKYVSDAAYLQPQKFEKNTTVVEVTLKVENKDRVYEAAKDEVIEYEAGKITTLIITLEKSGMQISTKIVNWTAKDPIGLTGMFFEVGSGSVNGFTNNDKISFHKISSSNTVAGSTLGTVGTASGTMGISLSPMWYRNDFTTGNKILAVSPQQTIGNGANTFSFTSTNGKDTPATDLLTAISNVGADVNLLFDFTHALSKVKVNLIAGDGFTNTDFTEDKVELKLNNFKLTGTVDVTDGKATATGSTSDVTPTRASSPAAGAAASFSALVMPQTIERETKIVTVTWGGKNYTATVAYLGDTGKKMVLEANKEHVINITLKKTGISLSATVAEWGTGDNGNITIQ